MDGRPSAPDSGPEPFELTEGSSRPPDIERELNALRARAYGPDADIEADPVAMARLAELETAHLAAVAAARRTAGATAPDAAVAAPAIEAPQEASPHRMSRAWLIAGVAVLSGLAIAAAVWNLAPRPDATLQQVAAEANSDIIRVLSAQGRGPVASTLRRFEPYHGVRVWSVENHAGKVCYVVWDLAASGRFSITCAAPGTEVALTLRVVSEGDEFGRWLADGSSIDFRFREDTVDVFVRPPAD